MCFCGVCVREKRGEKSISQSESCLLFFVCFLEMDLCFSFSPTLSCSSLFCSSSSLCLLHLSSKLPYLLTTATTITTLHTLDMRKAVNDKTLALLPLFSQPHHHFTCTPLPPFHHTHHATGPLWSHSLCAATPHGVTDDDTQTLLSYKSHTPLLLLFSTHSHNFPLTHLVLFTVLLSILTISPA